MMRQLIRRLEAPFHPRTGRFSPHARKFAGLCVLAMATYLILVGISDATYVWSGCSGYHKPLFDRALEATLAGLVGLALFPVVRLRWRRGRIRRRDPNADLSQPAASYFRALGSGVGTAVVAAALVLAIGTVDRPYYSFGPTTHYQTGSKVVNRVLDAWATGHCALHPTGRCDVLFTYEKLPLRTALADRACRSGNDGTHALCAISLEAGSLPREEICRRDAVAPLDQRVCPVAERNMYRRDMGLLIHGQRDDYVQW